MGRGWAEVEAGMAACAAQVPAGGPGAGAPTAFPAAVRTAPLGRDRSGALFWKLRCCPILAGPRPDATRHPRFLTPLAAQIR